FSPPADAPIPTTVKGTVTAASVTVLGRVILRGVFRVRPRISFRRSPPRSLGRRRGRDLLLTSWQEQDTLYLPRGQYTGVARAIHDAERENPGCGRSGYPRRCGASRSWSRRSRW